MSHTDDQPDPSDAKPDNLALPIGFQQAFSAFPDVKAYALRGGDLVQLTFDAIDAEAGASLNALLDERFGTRHNIDEGGHMQDRGNVKNGGGYGIKVDGGVVHAVVSKKAFEQVGQTKGTISMGGL